MWHQCLADHLRNMGFRPCKADYDLWIRENEEHYEYIAVIVDDLLIFSREPGLIIQSLKEVSGFELKGVGNPEYYSGADLFHDPATKLWEISAKTYIKNVSDRNERILEVKLRTYGSVSYTHLTLPTIA